MPLVMRSSWLRLLLATVLGIAVVSPAASAQRHDPPISARQFVSGNIQIKVTGAFAMNVARTPWPASVMAK